MRPNVRTIVNKCLGKMLQLGTQSAKSVCLYLDNGGENRAHNLSKKRVRFTVIYS